MLLFVYIIYLLSLGGSLRGRRCELGRKPTMKPTKINKYGRDPVTNVMRINKQ